VIAGASGRPAATLALQPGRVGLPRAQAGRRSRHPVRKVRGLRRVRKSVAAGTGARAQAAAPLVPSAEPVAAGARAGTGRPLGVVPALGDDDAHAALARPLPRRRHRPGLPGAVQVFCGAAGRAFADALPLGRAQAAPGGLGEAGGGRALVEPWAPGEAPWDAAAARVADGAARGLARRGPRRGNGGGVGGASAERPRWPAVGPRGLATADRGAKGALPRRQAARTTSQGGRDAVKKGSRPLFVLRPAVARVKPSCSPKSVHAPANARGKQAKSRSDDDSR